MNIYLAATDLVSAIYTIIMIVGTYQAPDEVLEKTRPFRLCLLACLVGCLAEAGCNMFEGDASKTSWLIALYFLAIISVDIVVLFYSLYIRALLADKDSRYFTVTKILTALSVVSLVLNLVMIATGRMFTVADGVFCAGSFYPYRFVIVVVVFVGIFALLVISREMFGFKNIWMTVIFMAFPALVIAVNTLFIEQMRNTIFPATAASLFIVYVVIQSKTAIQAEVDVQVLGRLSFYDTLTGLKNRRGYEDIIDNLPEEEEVAVVFCDANGLKAVNDNLGHASGDEFIKKIAKIICDAFPEGEVCRISGDEFVCIVKGMNAEDFREKMQNFEGIVREEGRIVAFGYETGPGKQFLELVKSAEEMMYSDKQQYYLETGKDRRR